VTLSPSPEEARVAVEAPAVFAGYGLEAPQLGIDDYKGLDVRGKIVVVLNGFPKGMKSDVGAHLNSEKRRVASQRGAVGLVTIRTLAEAKRRPWARMQETADEPSIGWTGTDGRAYTPAPNLRFRATLDTPAAEALFAGAKTPLTRVLAQAERSGGRPKGFALKQRISAGQQSSLRRFTSPTCWPSCPGSDPALAGEYVLLMAHLDHEGSGGRRRTGGGRPDLQRRDGQCGRDRDDDRGGAGHGDVAGPAEALDPVRRRHRRGGRAARRAISRPPSRSPGGRVAASSTSTCRSCSTISKT
jgi:hypothetical protein